MIQTARFIPTTRKGRFKSLFFAVLARFSGTSSSQRMRSIAFAMGLWTRYWARIRRQNRNGKKRKNTFQYPSRKRKLLNTLKNSSGVKAFSTAIIMNPNRFAPRFRRERPPRPVFSNASLSSLLPLILESTMLPPSLLKARKLGFTNPSFIAETEVLSNRIFG